MIREGKAMILDKFDINKQVFIIAEAGVNHNGSLDLAKEMIREAAAAKADCIKFQTFNTKELVISDAPKARYQMTTTNPKESQSDMLKGLELLEKDLVELKIECEKQGILFLSTPFDLPSAKLLNDLEVAAMKIPSSEITNLPFIRHLAGFGKPLLISTGMSTIGDVDRVYQELIKLDVRFCFLHCVSEYPSPIQDINLKAMGTLQRAFGVPVGYSDHSRGIHIPIAAAALGAKIIEKHFTLDRNLIGPDHTASIEPSELKEMITQIREVSLALGDGKKNPSNIEVENSKVSRKSLVASRDMQAGTTLTNECLTAKRPGTGIPPYMLELILSVPLSKAIKKDEILTMSHFQKILDTDKS